jgi:hypothetical protein
MIKKILSKMLFCTEDTVGNVLLHIPVGVITVIIAMLSPILALAFYYGFIKYELKESRIIHDKAYPDIQGSLWGIGIAAVITLIVKVVV